MSAPREEDVVEDEDADVEGNEDVVDNWEDKCCFPETTDESIKLAIVNVDDDTAATASSAASSAPALAPAAAMTTTKRRKKTTTEMDTTTTRTTRKKNTTTPPANVPSVTTNPMAVMPERRVYEDADVKGNEDFVDNREDKCCFTETTDESIKLAIVNVDDGGFIPDFNPHEELARPLTAPFHNIGHLSKLRDFLVKL